MHGFPILRDLVILVAVAVPAVVLAQRARVPTVVGFLLAGIIIGPSGLRLISSSQSVAGLAEVGVILLLFAIGLELSLSRIITLGRTLVQGGAVQVLGTIALVAVLGVWLGTPLNQSLFFGALVTLSSTAVVLKVYTDREELDTPHGRVVMGILLFQDLCIVPLMLLVPLLAGSGGGTGQVVRGIGVGLVVVGMLLVGGRVAVPFVLERVADLRNREIFTLSIVLFGLGAAYLTARFGLSLAIGAFIAGLVISESEYGLQALSDVVPFRDTFSGIFFISVGMLLDLGYVRHHLLLVTGGVLGLFVLKATVAAAAARSLSRSREVSLLSGLGLAQIGEFSFVLAGVGEPLGLLNPESYQLFLAVSVTSMLATPFVIAAAPSVAGPIARSLGRPALEIAPHEAAAIARLDDHAIIVGYGLNGRNLAKVLKAAGISYVILEQNGQAVRRARLDREPIYFGDGTRHSVLEHVGIERARTIVFAIASPAAERRGVAVARQLNPAVRIVVRTRYVAAIQELTRAGADEVVPEEFETSVEIFARVLRIYGVPSNRIEHEIQAIRSEHYGVLRGIAMPELRLDALRHLGVHTALDTIEVESGATAVDHSPTSLALRRTTGATLIAVVREGAAFYTPDTNFSFRPGDTAVLVGSREALDRAASLFRGPRPVV